jgi:hypothetical protein
VKVERVVVEIPLEEPEVDRRPCHGDTRLLDPLPFAPVHAEQPDLGIALRVDEPASGIRYQAELVRCLHVDDVLFQDFSGEHVHYSDLHRLYSDLHRLLTMEDASDRLSVIAERHPTREGAAVARRRDGGAVVHSDEGDGNAPLLSFRPVEVEEGNHPAPRLSVIAPNQRLDQKVHRGDLPNGAALVEVCNHNPAPPTHSIDASYRVDEQGMLFGGGRQSDGENAGLGHEEFRCSGPGPQPEHRCPFIGNHIVFEYEPTPMVGDGPVDPLEDPLDELIGLQQDRLVQGIERNQQHTVLADCGEPEGPFAGLGGQDDGLGGCRGCTAIDPWYLLSRGACCKCQHQSNECHQ